MRSGTLPDHNDGLRLSSGRTRTVGPATEQKSGRDAGDRCCSFGGEHDQAFPHARSPATITSARRVFAAGGWRPYRSLTGRACLIVVQAFPIGSVWGGRRAQVLVRIVTE